MATERRGIAGPRTTYDGLPTLHALAAGIDRDRDAVVAGPTLPWNSGVVEGHVNRIKMLKRQMFGRAGFALLRKRVLSAHRSMSDARDSFPAWVCIWWLRRLEARALVGGFRHHSVSVERMKVDEK
ncbi:hypothetical protein ACICHK_40135 [Streptomyces sp. AHU1]|uniref:hypothetical protein n=1 Tax=Streptomyces sp. AHU1 TaxID=3377215 RepID=UPI003878059C